MKELTSNPSEFQELRDKLAGELLKIGRNSPACKRHISVTGMAHMMGISKENAFALLESLEQEKDIVIERQKILIKSKPE